MPIRDMILPEFDHEMAGTRNTLARIPDDLFQYKAHEKSFTMQDLASHLANLPNWAVMVLKQDSYDVNPGEGKGFELPRAKTTAELLEIIDKNIDQAREAIESASDEQLQAPWSLKADGKEIFTLPRIAVLRSFVMNHMIHHRGQLTMYLRLNNLPLPALYGPSADEESMETD